MELGTNSTQPNDRIYLQIIWGYIRQRVPEDTEGAQVRVNKNDDKVTEILHRSVAGYITRIDKYGNAYGDRYILNIETPLQTYALQLPVNDRLTRSFLYRLPNIDLHKPVRISVFSKDDRTYLATFQENDEGKEQAVEAYFSRDNPRDLPQAREVMINGKVNYDFVEQNHYLEMMIIGKSEKTGEINVPEKAKVTDISTADNFEQTEEDDLPF